MRHRTAALLAAFVCLLAAEAASAAGPYSITGTAVTRDGGLVRTEITVQAGPHPLDRFKAVRLVKDGPGRPPRGAVLLLPPLGPSFAFYEHRDGAAGSSIAGFFAARGFDVYGYALRYDGIPAGACEAGVVDCSVMAGWGFQSMVEDVAFVRGWIEQQNPGVKVVAGGASLGGMLAIAVADAAPGDYVGIFPWEGMMASDDPEVVALNQGYCAALEAQLAGGAVFDGVGVNVFRQVTVASRLAPGGLTAIPLFPPFLTNHQVMVALVSVPTPGPVSMPVPSYIQMNGSLAEDRLFFADEERIYENVSRFVNVTPNATVRDLSCSLAGVETAFTDGLGAFAGSVLMIGGGRGFGAYMGDQLARFTGSSDKQLLVEPEFGHIDHMMTPDHRDYVERPIFEWAKRVLGVD